MDEPILEEIFLAKNKPKTCCTHDATELALWTQRQDDIIVRGRRVVGEIWSVCKPPQGGGKERETDGWRCEE